MNGGSCNSTVYVHEDLYLPKLKLINKYQIFIQQSKFGFYIFYNKENIQTDIYFCFLFQMSKKYGSVFTIYLGPKKVVVLAGYQTVKKALVNYAEEFGNRDMTPIFFEISKGHGKKVNTVLH